MTVLLLDVVFVVSEQAAEQVDLLLGLAAVLHGQKTAGGIRTRLKLKASVPVGDKNSWLRTIESKYATT